MPPSCPDDGDGGIYDIFTLENKIVSDYAGISMVDVEELDYFVFLTLFRDAIIFMHSQSEEGLKYLEKCKRLSTTKADRATLRQKFGKEVPHG